MDHHLPTLAPIQCMPVCVSVANFPHIFDSNVWFAQILSARKSGREGIGGGRKRIKINVSWLVHCFTRILFSWWHMICWIFALTSITAMATDIFFCSPTDATTDWCCCCCCGYQSVENASHQCRKNSVYIAYTSILVVLFVHTHIGIGYLA